MSHEIEITDGKANFVYVGQKAWHGLGSELPAGVTSAEMLNAAGLDWTVDLHPAYVNIGGKQVDTGSKALVRSSDSSILSVVSKDWKPMQNSDAFEFFNDFVEKGSMTMETAGSLKKGKMVFALAKVKSSIEIFKDDPIEQYLLFSNPHEYGRSIDVRLTPTRVVCNNTLTMSLQENLMTVDNRKSSVRTNHRNKFDPDFVIETLGLAEDKFQRFGEVLKFLTTVKYDPTQIEYYMNDVFPHHNTEKREKIELSRTAQTVLDSRETQAGVEFGRGTWYELFNLVTFSTNHVLGRSAETRLRSAWYGINANRNALALKKAVEYAKAAA